MKNWYKLRRFDCPRCGQKLAVQHGQVERNDVVTCQDCNLDILLALRGQSDAASPRLQPDWMLVELKR